MLWFRATFGRPVPPLPAVGPRAALRPIFIPRDGKKPFSAGTAVAVRPSPGSDPVLLTALHLFGPAGGMERNLRPGEIDGVIREIWLSPVATSKLSGRARGSLRVDGPALAPDATDVSPDVAAFALLPETDVDVLPLATRLPRMGEWLWLVGDIVDHRPQEQRFFPGQVRAASPRGVLVRMKEKFPATAFSGAPLVNSDGHVAALLIGGDDRRGLFIANPAAGIRGMLRPRAP